MAFLIKYTNVYSIFFLFAYYHFQCIRAFLFYLSANRNTSKYANNNIENHHNKSFCRTYCFFNYWYSILYSGVYYRICNTCSDFHRFIENFTNILRSFLELLACIFVYVFCNIPCC